MSNEKYNSIPAAACTMCVGEFELGDNGENAKTAPLRLVARSGKPIEHWYWGNVVHDLSGMRLHKPRLPVDYAHDTKEVIGYLNKFESTSGDLVTSGALVPFGENDRATEIIHKMKNGVPYEASINFGGDGIKVQEIQAGELTEVNGYQFEGPGIVIREWPLRGVAVCPYGADMNTESAMSFSNNNKTFSAAVVTHQPKAETEEEAKMSEPVEVKADAEVVEAEKKEVVEVVESELAKPEAEGAAPVEAVEAEAKQKKEPEVELDAGKVEFARMVESFGADVATKVFLAGGKFEDAAKLAYEKAQEEIAELRQQVADSKSSVASAPVKMSEQKKPVKLFNTGK